MPSPPYKLPASSGLIPETAVESKYKKSVFNENTKKWEETEVTSEISKYKGGALLGWNLYGKEKSKIVIYDNAEKAEGKNFGPITLNASESVRDWFGSNGLQFKNALWLEVVEGAVEGCVFCDIE